MEFEINYMAVVVATIVNFILAFLWYTPLFGKAWATEMGFDTSRKPTTGQLTKGLLMTVVGNFLMAFVFAHNMEAWTFVPGTEELTPAGRILNAAIFTWLGFYLPVDLGAIAWENRSWKLLAINTGYHLTMLVVAATILALW